MPRRPSDVLSIIDAATVRVSTYAPAESDWPGESAASSEWLECIRKVWATTEVRASVGVASPVLAERVAMALSPGMDVSSEDLRRLAHSLARYLVRMEGRATPFGLFAGVAPLTFGDELLVRVGEDHRTRTHVDIAWISAIIAELERQPAVRACLLVTGNDLCTVRGDRLVITWLPHAGWGSGTERSPRGSDSLRVSPAVRSILDAAQKPVSVRELLDLASAADPLRSWEYFDLLVGRLIEVGALITCLRPNGTTADVLSHVLVELYRTGAAEVTDARPAVERLKRVRALMGEADRQRWTDTSAREQLADEIHGASSATAHPYVANLRHDCSIVLPSTVADEALAAARALLRTGPQGHRSWGAYHAAFVARYGFGAIVPVRELTDSDAGLGFPAHFSDDAAAEVVTSRDALLLRLAHEVVADGRMELVLDEQLLRMFEAAEPGIRRVPSSLDVCLDVRAATADNLAAGRFLLGMRGLGRSAAATAGRFIELFDPADRHRMLKAFSEVPPCTVGGIVAQLSSPPSNAGLENVVHTLPMVRRVISLGEHRSVQRNLLRLDDLAVTADSDRLYLVSMERRCTVQPLMGNAAARHTMPFIARFLSEVSRAGDSPLAPFSWGVAASHLPMRPRVRHGRTVLSPAQWTVNADASTSGSWEDRVDEIRLKLGDAAVVQVGTGDQLLRLNLDQARDCAVLREYVRGKSTFTVAEAAGRRDYGWIGGRAHEIVVPMVSARPPTPAPPLLTADAPLPIVTMRDAVLPGGEVVFARLYGPRDLADSIVVEHLPALLAAWEKPPMCWWIKFRDPNDHVRLRLHVSDYGEAMMRVGTWAAKLRDLGLVNSLVLDTYQPETARYGSGTILQAAERLFAADSAAVAAQLMALDVQRRWSPQALTAASLVDLTCAMMGSQEAGIRWLVESSAKRGPGAKRPRLDPNLVRQARSFAPPSLVPAELAEAWQQRRLAAAAYAARLSDPSTHLDATDVLGSLLHMHHNRAHGIDPEHETHTHRLARAIALTTSHLVGSGGV